MKMNLALVKFSKLIDIFLTKRENIVEIFINIQNKYKISKTTPDLHKFWNMPNPKNYSADLDPRST